MDLDHWKKIVWDGMEAKGFHDGRTASAHDTRVRLALVMTEIAEAMQVVKRKWKDAPVADQESGVVAELGEELADVAIRLLDLAGCVGLSLGKYEKTCQVEDWSFLTRDEWLITLGEVCYDVANVFWWWPDGSRRKCEAILKSVGDLFEELGLDFEAAVRAKMDKNMARPRKYGTPQEGT